MMEAGVAWKIGRVGSLPTPPAIEVPTSILPTGKRDFLRKGTGIHSALETCNQDLFVVKGGIE